MASSRLVFSLAAMSLALAACTTGSSTAPAPAASGSWTQIGDSRVAVTDSSGLSYSVALPPGWGVTPGTPGNRASVQAAPRDGGSLVEIGVVRAAAGETPEQLAVRLAQRMAPTTDTARPAGSLAPIPLQIGGRRRAQVYSVPQRATERMVVVALVGDSGVWGYQILNAASRGAYDRSMPLMRNIVASYRPVGR
jgi:hypothetical protein